jgi:hypothetical protein
VAWCSFTLANLHIYFERWYRGLNSDFMQQIQVIHRRFCNSKIRYRIPKNTPLDPIKAMCKMSSLLFLELQFVISRRDEFVLVFVWVT